MPTNSQTSKFRNGSGQLLTTDLFFELAMDSKKSLYTLKPFDLIVDNEKVYPSLKKLYLEEEDITEFTFAEKYVESYAHWERLLQSRRLKEHFDQWRKELLLKIKSRALKGIIRDSVKDNKYEANKFILTNGWVDKTENDTGKKRGRPSKEEIKNELVRQAEIDKDLMDDLNRIKELN
jgi:hypothetical protein